MNDKNYPKTFTLIQIVVQLHSNKPDDKIETPEERKMLDELFSMLCVYESWHLRGWYKNISTEGLGGYGHIYNDFLKDNPYKTTEESINKYKENVTKAAEAVKLNRPDWFEFMNYDPPFLRPTKENIENERRIIRDTYEAHKAMFWSYGRIFKRLEAFLMDKEVPPVITEEEWVAHGIKENMRRNEAASNFLKIIRELYKKNPFWDEKGLETVKGKKRISKYENEKAQVVKAGKKLIAANPKWRISNIVNKRNGYIHESIKATLRNSGLDETEWPPLSTLATWIGPHVTNKRPGR